MAATELNKSTELEQRIESLEARNAFQDDVIEQLNQELTVHQAQLTELKENMHLIAARIKESASSTDTQVDVEPPPPHY